MLEHAELSRVITLVKSDKNCINIIKGLYLARTGMLMQTLTLFVKIGGWGFGLQSIFEDMQLT